MKYKKKRFTLIKPLMLTKKMACSTKKKMMIRKLMSRLMNLKKVEETQEYIPSELGALGDSNTLKILL